MKCVIDALQYQIIRVNIWAEKLFQKCSVWVKNKSKEAFIPWWKGDSDSDLVNMDVEA